MATARSHSNTDSGMNAETNSASEQITPVWCPRCHLHSPGGVLEQVLCTLTIEAFHITALWKTHLSSVTSPALAKHLLGVSLCDPGLTDQNPCHLGG